MLDYSEELEYSQDNKLDFDIRDCRNGVNHLICGGSGQGLEREIYPFVCSARRFYWRYTVLFWTKRERAIL